MVATSVNNMRGIEALTRMRDLVEEHGTDEQKERLTRIMGGSVPAPNRAPIEHAVYTSEALTILFEMVIHMKEASKPKKRGRPPKDRTREAS
jgi:hypothetical protein